MRILKSNTSRDLKKKFPFLKDVYCGTAGTWSNGYIVFTVGINEEVIKKYIEQQGNKIRGKSSLYSGYSLHKSWRGYCEYLF
ncbi:MAG: transposase [Alphaproteobacteria bacterium]|nr:transposase [Alphaproteobacteria bacterium]